MTTYTIAIDNIDANDPGAKEKPWNAAAHLLLDDGETGDLLAVGLGATPSAALRDLADDLETLFGTGDPGDPCPESTDGIAHHVTDGSCDNCGSKNRG